MICSVPKYAFRRLLIGIFAVSCDFCVIAIYQDILFVLKTYFL